MKKMLRLAAFLLLVLGSSLVLAQDAFDHQMSSVILLQSKSVQKEIGVTEQQRTAMNKFADSHRSKLKAYYTQLAKQSTNKPVSPNDRHLLTMFTELKNGVLRQLTAAQLRRLREISLQELNFSALGDPTVANHVGLSNSQQKRVRAILNGGITYANKIQMTAINRATADLQTVKPKSQADQEKLRDEATRRAETAAEGVAPQVGRIKADTRSKVMAILTPQQRATWNALLGKSFHISD